MLSLFVLLASSLIALAGTTTLAAAERRVALVIGNSNYRDLDLTLINPKNDAEDVAAALRKLGFDVLVTTDADYASFGRSLQKFARMAASADTSLFYYAGHAVQYQGRNYLLPTDAEVKDDIGLEYGTVPVDDALAALKRTSGIKIMVLDACRNNPVADRLSKLPPAPQEDIQTITPGRTRGISRIYKSEGLIIAYAAAPGDVALDGKDRNSPYTAAFLKWISQPGLEIETMFRRIAADVVKKTNGQQRPETYVSLDSDYVLNQADRFAWNDIKDSNDPEVFRDFLKRFPSSYYSIEAHYRLDAIERALEERRQEALQTAEEKRLAEEKRALAAAEMKACADAQERYDATAPQDQKALQALVDSKPCDKVLTAAQARLAALRVEMEKKVAACTGAAKALDAIGARDSAGLQALIATKPCANVAAAAAARLAALKALLAQEADEACRRDAASFGAIGARDLRSLQALIAKTACDRVKTAAEARVAAVKEQLKREAAACARDKAAFAALSATDEAGARKLLANGSCAEVRTAARGRIAAIAAARARLAALCQAESDKLSALAKTGTLADVRVFRQKAQCPATAAAADKVLQELAAHEACARDNAALAAVAPQDENGLRVLIDQTACAAVKTAAEARLAKLVAARAEQARICSQDQASLNSLGANASRTALENLRSSVKCPDVAAGIDKRLVALAAACTRDQAALTAIASDDRAALQAFLDKATCPEAKSGARSRIAEIDKEKVREDEICRRDDEKLKPLASAGDPSALAALRPTLRCPATIAALDAQLTRIRTACGSETSSLAAISATDADGLRAFIAKSACADVKRQAQSKLADLEAVQEKVCTRENEEFAALQKRGAEARADVISFEKTLTCDRLRPAVKAALENLGPEVNSPTQIRAAQGELKRLGCFEGPADGKLDEPMRAAWKHYFERIHRRKLARLEPRIDDNFIDQLKQRSARICPPSCPKGQTLQKNQCVPAAVARREEEPHRPRPPRHERETQQRRSHEQRQAHERRYREQESQRPHRVARERNNGGGGGGGGGAGGLSTSLGTGF